MPDAVNRPMYLRRPVLQNNQSVLDRGRRQLTKEKEKKRELQEAIGIFRARRPELEKRKSRHAMDGMVLMSLCVMLMPS
jgi:hypothetical protein